MDEVALQWLKHASWLLSAIAPFWITLKIFDWLEDRASDQAKLDLTKYLRNLDLVRSSRAIPNFSIDICNRIFGTKYFTWKCFRRSLLFSTFWTLAFLLVSYFVDIRRSTSHVSYWSIWLRGGAIGGLSVWLPWSLLIDFFSLLKTRLVLNVIQAKSPSFILYVIIALADLTIGFLLFGIGCLLVILIWYILSRIIPFPIGSIEVITFFNVALIELHHGNLKQLYLDPLLFRLVILESVAPFRTVLSALLYASLMPSLWLWLYVVSTIIAKFMKSMRPVYAWMIYLMDVESKPIRSIGFVAAAIFSTLYLVATF
jgi:hypothetical protein